MAANPAVSVVEHFAGLPDPRMERTRLHELLDVLVIAACAVICSAESWEDVAEFGRSKFDGLKRFLKLPNGIPSQDSFNRVFVRLDPQALQECFLSWLRAVREEIGAPPIALDGKALRRSLDRAGAKGALHRVRAGATANHLTLGQVAVDDTSNEITAIPKLLQRLDVSGAIVTIDAMGCQKEIAAQIREGGGDYVLAVKDNQGRLYEEVLRCFERHLDDERPEVEPNWHEAVDGRADERGGALLHRQPSGDGGGLRALGARARGH